MLNEKGEMQNEEKKEINESRQKRKEKGRE